MDLLDQFQQLRGDSEKECVQSTPRLSEQRTTDQSAIIEGARVVLIGGSSAVRGRQGSVTQLIGNDALITFDDKTTAPRIVPIKDLLRLAYPEQQRLDGLVH